MDDGYGLVPLPGGHSGETFLAESAGERSVVRIYADRGARRGPSAVEVDAAVLRLVRGLLPVPEVLEVRRPDPHAGTPGLLVTTFLPGERLEQVLPRLDEEGLSVVGENLGTALARLAHVPMLRGGVFADGDLRIEPFPPAADLVDRFDRSVLVHGDFNPTNLLVDPDSLELTGVLDWELAHAGSPLSDLGNLLRSDRAPALVAAVTEAYLRRAGELDGLRSPEEVLEHARAADLRPRLDARSAPRVS